MDINLYKAKEHADLQKTQWLASEWFKYHASQK
jgi:hypothetical protein